MSDDLHTTVATGSEQVLPSKNRKKCDMLKRHVMNEQEEPLMRLRREDEHVVAQFSFPGEIVALSTRGACWLPFYLPGQLEHPIGVIHSITHEVRLRASQDIADRQIVVLGPTPINDVLD